MNEEYNEWYHINYKKVDQLILLLEREEYEFCKLTFKKFNDGEFKNENELNNYLLSILKSHSRENIISKVVSFEGIINLLATQLNEFDKNGDTSFNGYLILEQYHSMAVRIEKLAREAMVEIAISEASSNSEVSQKDELSDEKIKKDETSSNSEVSQKDELSDEKIKKDETSYIDTEVWGVRIIIIVLILWSLYYVIK